MLLAAAVAHGQVESGGRLLVVAADSFLDAVQPLAEWRTAVGQQAAVVPLSQAGTTPSTVRTFIRNAWNFWPVRPEYVLLFCNPTQLEGYSSDNDCYYGDMTGDWRMEIPVGRLPAWSKAEARVLVAKTLAYERLTGWTDTTWLLKGSTTVQEGNPSNPDSFYLPDCYFAHSLWLANGYTRCDTFYNLRGHNSTDLNNALNEGRSFITYRGSASGHWNAPFEQFRPGTAWRNRFRTPILVAGTCGTVTLAPGEEMLGDESVRFGTDESLGGAVAYFGTTRAASTVTRYRSAVYRGFFHGLFADSLTELGPATVRGRRWLDSLYQNQSRYQEWALIGDPCLRVWTGPPRPISVAHPSWVRNGPQVLTVTVEFGGDPVPGAFICAWLDSSVYCLDTTDAQGSARLDVNPDHPGAMRITVTGRDLIPYEGTCGVYISGAPFITHLRHELIDSFPAGNSDGLPAAGETLTVPLWVVNVGDSTALGVRAWLQTADSLVALLDSVRDLGTIPAQESAFTGRDGFRFAVSPACPDGRKLEFRLHVTDSAGRTWDSDFSEIVANVELSFAGDTVRDSSGNRNGRLDPNETADLIVRLRNAGSATARQTTARLRSSDARLVVLDSIGTWGNIPGRSTRDNNSDRFTLRALEMVPSTPILCTLLVRALGCSTRMLFTISPGVLSTTDPCCDGPRIPALYWAFDDVDSNYAQRPAFEWIDASGAGTNLGLRDNQTVTLDLPAEFGPFRYYGRRYTQLSVCSNGWVAPGSSSFIGWANYRLPRGLEPPVLAVLWDDLVPDTARNVWTLFDTAAHRFVVQWDSVSYRSQPTKRDQFQLVIHDTTRAGPDGNSTFDFQYRTANNHRYGTMGIQDPTDTIGITVVCDNAYARAAALLLPSRCIRFTTELPTVGLAGPAVPQPSPARVLHATVVRGVLKTEHSRQNTGNRAESLDAAGRRVMVLASGDNDVTSLAPGVYFVHEAQAQAQAQAVRKVIIAR